MSDYGITGIGGYSPYMNGLGGYGLGAGSSFGTYADPSTMMMGMGYGNMGMGYGNMGMGMGMMGMYNPTFMSQMNQAYQNMELSQLQHAGTMHDMLLQHKVDAYKAEDAALFQKSMEDTNIEKQVVNLAEVIRNGDADAICQEFDKLKMALLQKYNTYLKANSDRLDPTETINGHIEDIYAAIVSKKTGEQVSLRNDIRRYGETAFSHGFNKDFFGKSDYHDKYTEETLNYLFGTRIDNKGGKDRMEKVGSWLGRGAEGATVTGVGMLCGTLLGCLCKKPKWGAAIGALAGLAGDVFWQCGRA